MRFSIRNRIYGIVTGAVVVVLVATIGIAWALQDLASARDNESRIYEPAALASSNLLVAMLDQETALRGYALTDDPSFLQPNQTGIDEQQAALDSLHKSVANRPHLLSLTQAASAAASQWRDAYATNEIARVQQHDPSATAPATFDGGKALFDAFRVQEGNLQTAIQADRVAADAKTRSAQNVLTAVIVTVFVLIIVAGLLATVQVRRWILTPLDSLVGSVAVVASGDIEHEVEIDGPSELVQVATSVETMRKRIVEELQSARAARTEASDRALELARSNSDLEQFAYVASHDLQEPLRKVASFCQLLEQRYAENLDDKGRQYIEFAVDGAKRMQQLINDLLSFSRVGRNTEKFEPVDLNEAANQGLRNIATVVKDCDAKVQIDSLPTVQGDKTLLEALFQNLFGNAVKFRSEDRMPEIRVWSEQDGGNWIVRVQDNGIGIEPRYAEKVFVIFQRLYGRDQYEGTGIGLALCKKIVEHHGGKIELEVVPDHSGTTVRFSFPVQETKK